MNYYNVSLCSGITNSSGVASVTVSNISAETTFTATYSNVSDTCTVTVPSYLYYDACNSSANLSNYTTVVLGEGSSTSYSLTYDSNMNAYKLSHSNTNTKALQIADLNGEDNFTFEMDFYYPVDAGSSLFNTGLAVFNGSSYFCGFCTMYDNGHKFENVNYQNKSWKGHGNQTSIANPALAWNHIKITVQGLSVYAEMKIGNNTYNYTKTLGSGFNTRNFGIVLLSNTSNYAYIRNIKAEAL